MRGMSRYQRTLDEVAAETGDLWRSDPDTFFAMVEERHNAPQRQRQAEMDKAVADLIEALRLPQIAEWLDRQPWARRYAETRTAAVLAWPAEATRRLWRRIA